MLLFNFIKYLFCFVPSKSVLIYINNNIYLICFFTFQFAVALIGKQGLVIRFLNVDNDNEIHTENPLQISLLAFKCILCLLTILDEDKSADQESLSITEVKENISDTVLRFLFKGLTKSQDEFLYCKVSLLSASSTISILTYLYIWQLKTIMQSSNLKLSKRTTKASLTIIWSNNLTM